MPINTVVQFECDYCGFRTVYPEEVRLIKGAVWKGKGEPLFDSDGDNVDKLVFCLSCLAKYLQIEYRNGTFIDIE